VVRAGSHGSGRGEPSELPPIERDESPASADFWIARQPIVDRKDALAGYELLYRASPTSDAFLRNSSALAARTIVEVFMEMNLADICGEHRIYLKITRDMILDEAIEALPRHRVVFEVPPIGEQDGRAHERVRGLANKCYRIALDDFAPSDPRAPLLDVVDAVKIDLGQWTDAALDQHVAVVSGRGAKVIASGVHKRADLERARARGCHLFLGSLREAPEVLAGKRSPSMRASVLRVLQLAEDPSASTTDLERAILGDVSLAYRLLRLLNSSLFAPASKIESVRHAIVLLGRERLRRWIVLNALSGLDDRPSPLLNLAAVRGRMCETIAEELTRLGAERGAIPPPAAFFSAGLFSLVGAVLGVPVSEIVRELPLAPEIADALTGGKGIVGRVLESVSHYQSGEWVSLDLLGLPGETFADAYFAAVGWADELERELTTG
jgi:c-di-GMP phosphodiesterase